MTLNNEEEAGPLLKMLRVWRVLLAFEGGLIGRERGAEVLGLSVEDFMWLRSIALTRAKAETAG